MPRYRWLVWGVYLAAWTTFLLIPVPVQHIQVAHLDLKLIVAKTFHISAYALLAVLTGWLKAPPRWRWLLLFVITVHGTITELLQLATDWRTGLLTDVGWDNLGIGLGLLASWKWWTAQDQSPAC